MPILNSANDDFETAATDTLEGLQQQRGILLSAAIDAHVGIGLLAGVEAGRLAQKYGADDMRAQLMRERGDAAAARVTALAVEQEIAMVRTPPPPDTGALIHGRITDTMQRATGLLEVQLVNDKGQAVSGIASTGTDDFGYFAFQLTADMVKAVDSKASLLVRADDVQLVPAAATPFSVGAGATVVADVALSTAELERLGLRVPVAVNPVTSELSDADDTAAAARAAAEKAAADKEAAYKAAADKAAADKAAADKAAADKAAADKAAADKAAADKAAADKAAADKAAADKAAADKAAADKAAAAKAAAEKAAADKAAADKAAADKAAAEKAAADKAAADKAAADKAAADKAAAAKAAAEKAAADKAAADKAAADKAAADKAAAAKAAAEKAAADKAAADKAAADKAAADKAAADKTKPTPPARGKKP